MTRHEKFPAASSPLGGKTAGVARPPLAAPATPIGAHGDGSRTARRDAQRDVWCPTGETGAPNLSPVPTASYDPCIAGPEAPIAPIGAGQFSAHVAPTGEAGAPNLSTFPVRIARVAGEAFDADQYGWSCEDCGRDEYGCECELPDNDWPVLTDFPGGAKLTIEEVQDRIARVFMGVSR